MRFIFEKLAYAMLTLLGVVTVVFFLFNILPGDPARMMLDQREDSEQLALLKKKYGFDQPIAAQYFFYLNDLSPISWHSKDLDAYSNLQSKDYGVVGSVDLGSFDLAIKTPYLRDSFQKSGKPVSEIIADTLPNTFVLALASISLALIIGILFGILSALNKDGWVDRSLAVFSTLGMSIPSFFSAIIFAWLFGFVLHKWTGLPMMGNLYEVDDLGEARHLELKNLILPAFVLGIRPLGVVTQLMRNALLDVLNQDYIRTARAKGLSRFYIIRKHAMKNSLNPVVTAISGWFASLLAGAVFVEYIFNWNGLGKEIVNALNTLDLPVIMGSVLVISTAFILINILVDFIYTWLDPKVSL